MFVRLSRIVTAPWRAIRGGWRALRSGSTRRMVAVLTATFVVAAALSASLVWYFTRPAGTRITAYFTEAVSVFPGSDVRVLGVKVGTVNTVKPVGQLVRVTMTVNPGVAIPAGADAAVIAPSIIADRYVQLTPAYTGGPQLPDHATIPASRTVTPVELDQVYKSLNKLAYDLGPNGVNRNGALNDAINTGAANLAGNGKAFGNMIAQFSKMTQTLSNSRGDLTATIGNLQLFTTMLKNNDSQVRQANQQLAQVFGFLNGDKQSLGTALNELGTALQQVKAFVQNNRSRIQSNVSKLSSITQLLSDQRASLAEAFNDIPLAADNFLNLYDPSTGTLTGRGDLNELYFGPCSYLSNPTQKGCPTDFSGGSGSGSSGSAGSGQAASSATLPLPSVGTVEGGR